MIKEFQTPKHSEFYLLMYLTQSQRRFTSAPFVVYRLGRDSHVKLFEPVFSMDMLDYPEFVNYLRIEKLMNVHADIYTAYQQHIPAFAVSDQGTLTGALRIADYWHRTIKRTNEHFDYRTDLAPHIYPPFIEDVDSPDWSMKE